MRSRRRVSSLPPGALQLLPDLVPPAPPGAHVVGRVSVHRGHLHGGVVVLPGNTTRTCWLFGISLEGVLKMTLHVIL